MPEIPLANGTHVQEQDTDNNRNDIITYVQGTWVRTDMCSVLSSIMTLSR